MLDVTVKVSGLWVPRGALRSSALATSTRDLRCSAGTEQVIDEMGFIAPARELDSSADACAGFGAAC